MPMDYLGNAPAESPEPVRRDADEPHIEARALALSAIVMATCSLLGLGVLNGSTFLDATWNLPEEVRAHPPEVVTLLGAALAVLPLYLGWKATRSATNRDGWAAVVGRSAMLVALVSLLARLALAAAQVNGGGGSFSRF
jgi:hypothetical protein